MTLSLEQWIINKEGLRLTPYTDTHGMLTVGYGHNLTANGISIAVAQQLLDQDIHNAQKDVLRNLPWTLSLDENRQAALVHLCFWIGITSLMEFKKMLAAVQGGDWQTAADEMNNSALHSDIPERCEEIANCLLTGNMP